MRSCIAMFFVLYAASSCYAGVIYVNGDPFADTGTHYSKSDTIGSSQIIADNFQLGTDAIINSVRWWGAWNFFTPAQDDFTVNFYADNAGLPDSTILIASRNVGNVVETSTGLSRSGNPAFPEPLFEFQSDIAPVSLSAATDYWISIYDSSGTNDSQYFLWRENAEGSAARSLDGGLSWSGRPREFAFQLEGETAAVPEPSSLSLFLMGCAGVAVAKRRRKWLTKAST